jgi:hypothetical protein
MKGATWNSVALPLSRPALPGTLPRGGGREKSEPLLFPGQPCARGERRNAHHANAMKPNEEHPASCP